MIELTSAAWDCRDNAHIIAGNGTRVGAAVLGGDGRVLVGCNVEHRFRCHDVHAEVNAISSLVASGERALKAIVIVAERENFTPCGSCLDWIFQFGGDTCLVCFQPARDGLIKAYTARDLMPYYPG